MYCSYHGADMGYCQTWNSNPTNPSIVHVYHHTNPYHPGPGHLVPNDRQYEAFLRFDFGRMPESRASDPDHPDEGDGVLLQGDCDHQHPDHQESHPECSCFMRLDDFDTDHRPTDDDGCEPTDMQNSLQQTWDRCTDDEREEYWEFVDQQDDFDTDHRPTDDDGCEPTDMQNSLQQTWDRCTDDEREEYWEFVDQQTSEEHEHLSDDRHQSDLYNNDHYDDPDDNESDSFYDYDNFIGEIEVDDHV